MIKKVDIYDSFRYPDGKHALASWSNVQEYPKKDEIVRTGSEDGYAWFAKVETVYWLSQDHVVIMVGRPYRAIFDLK
jgi:hypothetical protein